MYYTRINRCWKSIMVKAKIDSSSEKTTSIILRVIFFRKSSLNKWALMMMGKKDPTEMRLLFSHSPWLNTNLVQRLSPFDYSFFGICLFRLVQKNIWVAFWAMMIMITCFPMTYLMRTIFIIRLMPDRWSFHFPIQWKSSEVVEWDRYVKKGLLSKVVIWLLHDRHKNVL